MSGAQSVRLLIGDIGGTKTWLQVLEADAAAGAAPRVVFERHFDSHAYDDFLTVAQEFLAAAGLKGATLDRACLGVAGPVEETDGGQVVDATNLPWRLDSTVLAATLRIERVLLINDFKATGYSIEALDSSDLAWIHRAPVEPRAPRMVLGAGTGLGVAQLLWCGGAYEVIPSQGGHMSFAPIDEAQSALLAHMRGRQRGHVSFEHVLSGPGLVNIFEFLLSQGTVDETKALQAARLAGDPTAAIAEFGIAGRDACARRALEIFADIYASQAANLALVNLAYGGVYLAGGMAPKLLPVLDTDRFRAAFTAKGRMAPLLRNVPVAVILNARAGLIGAARAALRL